MTSNSTSTSVKYTKASNHDDDASVANGNGNGPAVSMEEGGAPDKSRASCMVKCALFSCCLGFVFAVGGIAW